MNKLKPFFVFILSAVFMLSSAFTAMAQQNDLERAVDLMKRASALIDQNRYGDAILVVSEAEAIQEKISGPDHPDVAYYLYILGWLYGVVGDYAQAATMHQRALAIREKSLGPNHPDVADSLEKLGGLYKTTGDYARAEKMYLRALDVRERSVGPDHQDAAGVLNKLGMLYNDAGDYARAEKAYQRALIIWEKTLGKEHASVAAVLNNLGMLYFDAGDYVKAETAHLRVLSMREKSLGPDHPDVAVSMNHLCSLYKETGDYARAEPLCLKSLAVKEKALDRHDPSIAASLNNLGGLYSEMGDYAKAETMYQRALDVYKSALGEEHASVAAVLNNLGLLHQNMGDYAKAETMMQKALAIMEKAAGPGSSDTAACFSSLGLLYNDIGDYAKAESMYRKALNVYEKNLGGEHPAVADALSNLGDLYKTLGDYARAESMLLRALAVREKNFGPDHPSVGLNLNNLGALYFAAGDYAKTGKILQRALAIQEKAFGPDHPDVALSLNNLAFLYETEGDYTRAEPLYRKALSIREKAVGPDHPSVASMLNNLAGLMAAKGDYASAHKLQMRAQNISSRLIDNVMGFTSEDQKMTFLADQRFDFETALGLVALHLAGEKTAVREIFDVWLGRKGVILESQRQYQEALVYSGDPEASRLFRELAGVRSSLSRLMFGGPGPEGPEAYQKKAAELEAREKELEAGLSKLSRAFAREKKVRRADAASVARMLPRNAVLVDFAQIRPVNYQARKKSERRGPARYLAFVLHAGNGSGVSLIDLGEASPIDQAVERLKNAMTVQGAADAPEACARLYDLVFAKLERQLAPADDVFISPDGALNLIPFEVLKRPDGRYLIEDYSFNYLASGRDLVGYGLYKNQPGRPLVMGDPDFDMSAPQTIRGASYTRSADMRSIRFGRLPNTREEAEAVHRILGGGDLFTGKDAIEEKLFQAVSPRILHLATHGFFLTDVQMDALLEVGKQGDELSGLPSGRGVQMDNPLLRSGLALAGANRALNAPNAVNSGGILTAEKVLSLKLQGTELVVLSACETGAGTVRTGEGVYGLRRAFTQAGADGLVMSMWSVPDQETQELMVQFYDAMNNGMSSRLALRTAALKEMEIVEARYGHTHPLFWGAFVYLGDPGESRYNGADMKTNTTANSASSDAVKTRTESAAAPTGGTDKPVQSPCFIQSLDE